MNLHKSPLLTIFFFKIHFNTINGAPIQNMAPSKGSEKAAALKRVALGCKTYQPCRPLLPFSSFCRL
jgi:hypothetical protein